MSSTATDPKPPSNTKFFLVIGLLMALIMVSLIIFSPSLVGIIVDTNQTANETKVETQNQTKLLIDYFDRENNTTHKVLSNQGRQIALLENESKTGSKLLSQLEEQSNQSQIIIKTLEILSSQNLNISKQIFNVSKEHVSVSKDHDILLLNTGNVTEEIRSNLERYGENSIIQLQNILNKTVADSKGAEIHRNITLDLFEITGLLKNITKDTNVKVKDYGGSNNELLKQIIPKLENITKVLVQINTKLPPTS